MAHESGRGNFIDGTFLLDGTITLESKNPSSNFDPIFSTKTSNDHVSMAIDSARSAYKHWNSLRIQERIKYLEKLKEAFIKNEENFAKAISLEMGKIISEARTEAKSLSARIDLMINHGLKRVKTENYFDLRAKARYHSQGVLAVIGPYNFPAHLLNAHIIPSLLCGNTIVFKPSEICLKVGEIYAECAQQAHLPSGVINMVQGGSDIGKALTTHPNIDGVLFTGSYEVGRKLKEALLDQPHKILALEMGGKNFAVVMDDADIQQAAAEIILGAYLTTGQRCSATSRVLIHERKYEKLKTILVNITKDLKPVDPFSRGMFGPLASKQSLESFLKCLNYGRNEGAKALIESQTTNNGAYVTPSIYEIAPDHPMKKYLNLEHFGPNIAIESFKHLDHAIQRINQSEYGLSNSIFTLREENVSHIYNECKSGVLNINRSTNGALGTLPFGGVKKSGNFRPAGIDAVRYATYPVAITELAYKDTKAPKWLKESIKKNNNKENLLNIVLRHKIESIFELYGVFADKVSDEKIIFNKQSFDNLKHPNEFYTALKESTDNALTNLDKHIEIDLNKIKNNHERVITAVKNCLTSFSISCGLSFKKNTKNYIQVPKGLMLSRSRAMLDRMYQDDFVVKEKKQPVIDTINSRGAFLASVDENPLVLFDAASQIATVGAGFRADAFLSAYEKNELDQNILSNYDLSKTYPYEQDEAYKDALKAKEQFESYLQKKAGFTIKSFSYAAGGAEANEVAFDICRQQTKGGHRIIAFDGAFHGRTIMSLNSTYNEKKRKPFEWEGYVASFIPFPVHNDPKDQPSIDPTIIERLSKGDIPHNTTHDALHDAELKSMQRLKEEAAKGNVCAVIIEPMQCEGGDRYASNRFFNYLRALTRGLKLPLIFDEVQTGFNLGRTFYWYEQFNLRDKNNNPDHPDCITLAKRAQLGVCLSAHDNDRPYTPHVLQLKRGLLHACAIDDQTAKIIEQKVIRELERLKEYFPKLIINQRATGFAFAFDLPSNELAQSLINKRFERGFMAYIAGEKTIRFRLNMASTDELIKKLFEQLFIALVKLRDDYEKTQKKSISNIEFKELNQDNFNDYKKDIERIEKNAYEKNRRDSMESLHGYLKVKDSLGLIATCLIDSEEIIAGYAIGGPLEYADIDGAKQDINNGKYNTFYSCNLTLDERVRGKGMGKMLKVEQIKRVANIKDKNNNPRYLYLSGRNRIGKTPAMTKINAELGAYIESINDNQYNEKNAKALYYKLPLQVSSHHISIKKQNEFLDCTNSIENPFVNTPTGLIHALKNNQLRAPVVSKLTLSNWATPNTIRFSELLQNICPQNLNHAYFTSGRGEMVDKGLRSIRYHRKKAHMVIGFSHQWLAPTTAAARSLSHNESLKKPFSFFDWPKIAHPNLKGEEESFKELKTLIDNTAPEHILGIVVELLGEHSAFTFSNSYLEKLDTIRTAYDIPLIFIETTSSLMRSGKGVFLSDHLNVTPDMALWFSNGQLGMVFVNDKYFVDKPLTLISTWDGDEISIARSYFNLLHAKNIQNDLITDYENRLKELFNNNDLKGMGCWHSIKFNNKDTLYEVYKSAKEKGVIFGAGFDNRLMICAKPDFNKEQFDKIIDVFRKIL